MTRISISPHPTETKQDLLDLVDMEGRREPGAVPPRQGGFDLIWDGGPAAGSDRPTSLPTMLGCYNARDGTQRRRPLGEVLAEEELAGKRERRQLAGGGGTSSGSGSSTSSGRSLRGV